jgi:hypothetical protein
MEAGQVHIVMSEPKMGIDVTSGPGMTMEITLDCLPIKAPEAFYTGVMLNVTREWMENAIEQLQRGLDIYQRKLTKELERPNGKSGEWFPGTMKAVSVRNRQTVKP